MTSSEPALGSSPSLGTDSRLHFPHLLSEQVQPRCSVWSPLSSKWPSLSSFRTHFLSPAGKSGQFSTPKGSGGRDDSQVQGLGQKAEGRLIESSTISSHSLFPCNLPNSVPVSGPAATHYALGSSPAGMPALLGGHFPRWPWLCHPSTPMPHFRLGVSVPWQKRSGQSLGGDVPPGESSKGPTPPARALSVAFLGKGWVQAADLCPGEPEDTTSLSCSLWGKGQSQNTGFPGGPPLWRLGEASALTSLILSQWTHFSVM